MDHIGTPLKSNAKRALLLGSGELGKEVVIELQRLGVETIACDSYENAPAMQVAHRSRVFSMLDGEALRKAVHEEKPHFIIPEVEAIATATLQELEDEGFQVVPSARATRLTMNREGIRRLVAEELKIPTSPYQFAETKEKFLTAVKKVGFPCVIKPIMSSSGKGQSVARSEADLDHSWKYSQEGGRAGGGKVIVEGFVEFDSEITLLTIRHVGGVSFCAPIGHTQKDGDYQESWQPHFMKPEVLEKAQKMADQVTENLGGFGLFGVELFIQGEEVIFSEVSPRPHDTGMVTLLSQDLSEFALHVRAILGLPIPNVQQHGPSASAVILPEGISNAVSFSNLSEALAEPDTSIRLFGKPEIKGRRRMGVGLARAATIEEARRKAQKVVTAIQVDFE